MEPGSLIRAELVGDDTSVANGITVRADAPVLALCRRLVAAGSNPATPLEAWRGEVLCLRVRSIGEGAGLAVKTDRHGTPRFVLTYAAASPAATTGLPATQVAPDAAARWRGRSPTNAADAAVWEDRP